MSLQVEYRLVRHLFDYRDGDLIWKVSSPTTGDIAGYKGPKYPQVGINGGIFYLHRIIFLWHHGYMPEHSIDHIDRNSGNNRIENLREVGKQCNMRNSKVGSHNKSGVTGVYFSEGKCKWVSQIKVDGKTLPTKSFEKFKDAVIHRHQCEIDNNYPNCNTTSSAYMYLKRNNLI